MLVILLTGGTKQRQAHEIERAKALWADYKRRRKAENDATALIHDFGNLGDIRINRACLYQNFRSVARAPKAVDEL